MITYHTCPICSKNFTKTNHKSHVAVKGEDFTPTCSRECAGKSKTLKKEVNCKRCSKLFTKVAAEIRRTKGNHFCSRSCAATYNNMNKSYGTRRSKLECHLESVIRKLYPTIPLECNSKLAIGSELDFYFPTLKLAIELNGIVHYQPIYGQCKLDKIIENDHQKNRRCAEEGIELCIIDTSACGYLTQKQKDKFQYMIIKLIEQVMPRYCI